MNNWVKMWICCTYKYDQGAALALHSMKDTCILIKNICICVKVLYCDFEMTSFISIKSDWEHQQWQSYCYLN